MRVSVRKEERLLQPLFAFLHQPKWSGCRSADTHCFVFASQNLFPGNLLGAGDKKGVGVGLSAKFEQHLTVAGLLAADKEYHVVLSRELLYVSAAAGYLTANSIFPHKLLSFETTLNLSYQLGELLDIFRRL